MLSSEREAALGERTDREEEEGGREMDAEVGGGACSEGMGWKRLNGGICGDATCE